MSSWSFGIRARLTAAVTIAFTAVAVIGAIVAVEYLRDRLVAGARADATAVLAQYTTGISQGGPIITTVDSSNPGVFFYLDSAGNEISQYEYVDMVATAMPDPSIDASRGQPQGSLASGSGEGATEPPPMVSGNNSEVTADSGSSGILAVAVNVDPIGTIHTVARGVDAVAVAQRIRLPDGVELEIGVSTSLQPFADSIHAIKAALWLAVPALALAVGLLTYLTVGRTLRPVHSITRRTRSITDANLSERVPVPDSGDDIANLATTMNEMLTRLDKAQQRQRQFIADASHELRSPIAASRTQLEVALAHPAHVEWTATAEAVLAEQTQLGQLVDDLLALSRLDEQGIGNTAPLDLSRLVADELARPRLVPIESVLPAEATVVGNRSHLTRAVRNVVDNACDHAESKVAVTVAENSGHTIIHVDDDGPGISADQRERIFDRFTRLDEPRHRDNGGAGLGLAIARQIIAAHGGEVTCAESPIGGARITFQLPRSPDLP